MVNLRTFLVTRLVIMNVSVLSHSIFPKMYVIAGDVVIYVEVRCETFQTGSHTSNWSYSPIFCTPCTRRSTKISFINLFVFVYQPFYICVISTQIRNTRSSYASQPHSKRSSSAKVHLQLHVRQCFDRCLMRLCFDEKFIHQCIKFQATLIAVL